MSTTRPRNDSCASRTTIPQARDWPVERPRAAAPLKYLSISTQETPEICEYPDSGKFLAQARNGAVSTFDIVQAKGESLDYWEREP